LRGSRRSVGRFSASVILAFTRRACSSSSLIRRASLTAQCTIIAPPIAASDHFTSGDSNKDGIGGSNLYGQSKLKGERGIFGADRSRGVRPSAAVGSGRACAGENPDK